MLKRRLQVLSVALLTLFVATFLYSLIWARDHGAVRPYKSADAPGNANPNAEQQESVETTDREARSRTLKKSTLHRFVYTSTSDAPGTLGNDSEPYDFAVAEAQERYETWYGIGRSYYDSFLHGVKEASDPRVNKENFHIWKTKWVSLTDRGMDALAQRKLRDFSAEDVYRLRRQELMERCSGHSRNRHIDLSRMVYDDRHKVVMCVVPKAACTTWKRIIWYLMGKETNKSALAYLSRDILTLNNGFMHTLNMLPKAEALRRLETYTTFFVTRQPYERLVSAYSSKLTNRSSNTYMKRLGRWIAMRQSDMYLHGLSDGRFRPRNQILEDPRFAALSEAEQQQVRDYIKVMENGSVSFEQFVRYILTEEKLKPFFRWDVHWRPQLALCNPCVVNYDHVVRFEDLAADSNFLLERLQAEDSPAEQVRLEEVTPWINASVATEYYKTLTSGEMHGIKKAYEKDTEVLGYS